MPCRMGPQYSCSGVEVSYGLSVEATEIKAGLVAQGVAAHHTPGVAREIGRLAPSGGNHPRGSFPINRLKSG
jgi:hypothetical protein